MSTSALVDVNQLSASEAPALHAELERIGVDRAQPNYATIETDSSSPLL
ncbi:hypothetical protein [Microcoleus asticus]|nr:hypothetical protein [Microcoleus asticus]